MHAAVIKPDLKYVRIKRCYVSASAESAGHGFKDFVVGIRALLIY